MFDLYFISQGADGHKSDFRECAAQKNHDRLIVCSICRATHFIKKGRIRMEIKEVQEELLDLLPLWYCQITKIFEQCLDNGVSLDLYYCIRAIQWGGGLITMTALADRLQITKQHMTKKVNRLVELNFVERVYDPSDRRVVKVTVTEKGEKFAADFLEKEAGGLRALIQKMNVQEQADFIRAIGTLNQILYKTMEYGSYHASRKDGGNI